MVELAWKSKVRCLDSGLKVVRVWEKVQSADGNLFYSCRKRVQCSILSILVSLLGFGG